MQTSEYETLLKYNLNLFSTGTSSRIRAKDIVRFNDEMASYKYSKHMYVILSRNLRGVINISNIVFNTEKKKKHQLYIVDAVTFRSIYSAMGQVKIY